MKNAVPDSKPSALLLILNQWRIWLPVYVLGIGLIYQYSYWHSFRVNVMAYIGWQDVVRLSIPGIVSAVALVILTTLWVGFTEEGRGRDWPLIGDRASAGFRFVAGLGILFIFFIIGAWTFGVTYALVMVGGSGVAMLLFRGLRRTTTVIGARERVLRDAALLGLTVAPLMAFAGGGVAALGVLDGTAYLSASVPGQEPPWLKELTSNSELRYLGHVNEFEFFHVGGDTLVVRSELVPALQFQTVDKGVGRIRVPFFDVPRWEL